MRARFFHGNDAPATNRPRSLGAVVALLSADGDAILLDRRADADVLALPGGVVDEDETVLSALRREIAEETGLVLGDVELLGLYSDPRRVVAYPDGNAFSIVGACFVGRLPAGEIVVSAESREMCLLGWDEFTLDEVAATHRTMVADAREWAAGRRWVRVE